MNTHDVTEPVLRPDFAARVLEKADALALHRRKMRRLLAGTCGAACATAIALSWTILSRGAGTPAPRRLETLAATTPAPNRPDDAALGYLFPDAVPVATFATQYSDATEDSDLDLLPGADDGDLP